MKFIKIIPAQQKVGIFEAADFNAALNQIGLRGGHIDFGRVSRGLSIAVYEYGLYEESIPYFSLGHTLYAGQALVWRVAETGETVDVQEEDLKDISRVLSWLPTRIEAEKAITHGFIYRPQQSVNGEILWQWGDGNMR